MKHLSIAQENKQDNSQLTYPAKKRLIIGYIYYPIHTLFIAALVIMAFGIIFTATGAELSMRNLAYAVAVGILVQTLVYSGLTWRFLKDEFAKFKTSLGRNIKIAIVAAVAGQIVAIPYGLLMQHLGVVPNFGENQQLAQELLFANIPAMLIVMLVLAPIWEEIFFRGMIFAPIKKRSRVLAYAASALTFGLLHTLSSIRESGISVETLVTTTFYFCTAIVFSYTYEKTGSLWGAVAAHTVSNIIGVAWMVFI